MEHTIQQKIYNKKLHLKPVEEVPFVLKYSELTKRAKYDESVFDNVKFVQKNGQRKLFDTEMLFLLQAIKKLGREDITVLYVGAADGKHIGIYSKLFPKMKFILYDPRPFMIKESKTIEIHQDFFTDEDCSRYSGKIDAFISDIRTMDAADFKKQKQEVWQQQVEDDQVWQAGWVKKIKPKIYSLKFKLNWNKPKQKYFRGDIYLQPWVSAFSAETRLIGTTLEEIEYDPKEFEEKIFYFNTRMRFQHNHNTKKDELNVYCDCHDCQFENYIIKEYQKYNPDVKDEQIYYLIKQHSIKRM